MDFLFFATGILLASTLGIGVYLLATGKSLQERAINGIIMAAVVPAIVVGVLLFASNAFSAPKFTYFEWTEVYAGLEVPKDRVSPQCIESSSGDNRLTSNIGARQHLVGFGNATVVANYIHHSCAISSDIRIYDAIGIQMQYRINWKK